MATEPTDDQIAEALADAAIRLVEERHPTAPPVFRRRIARLYLRQMTGREKPPGLIPQASLAAYMGVSKQRVSELQKDAVGKLYLELRKSCPELFAR